MDVFTNTNKFKKIVIVLVFLILFNFCCPSIIKAGDLKNATYITIASLFFWVADLPQKLLEELFLDNNDENKIEVTAENIIKGKFLLMNPNIFEDVSTNAKGYLDYTDVNTSRTNLRKTIAGWYYALRNLAIVALLSILVYVAIRMILTTVSQDKAKYKVMFKDWLVALCLLFIIHYFMVGILNMTDVITQSIGPDSGGFDITAYRNKIDSNIDTANRENDAWETDDDLAISTAKDAMKNTVIYLACVIMNYIFIGKYLIRSVTVIFLTLLAPISCITYPIDKISDGKAQAYNTWFQEFLYNVIIQPFHLLIYIVLIGSAAQLASDNLIYAMVCFGVMIPAEKFIKQMFGFKDKLGSPLGAFAGGAIANQMMNSLRSIGKGGSGGGGKDSDSGKSDDLPPNTERTNLPGTDGDEGPGGDGPDNGGLDEGPGGGSEGTDVIDGEEAGDDSSNDGPEVINGNETDNAETNAAETNAAETSAAETNAAETNAAETNAAETSAAETNAAETNADETGGGNSQSKWEKIKNSKLGRVANKAYNTKAAKAARARFSRNVMKKYGSNDVRTVAGRMAKRGLNKAYKGAKNVGRKAIKGATTLLGAAALGAFGAMFGKGAEGMALGAGLGGALGGSITKKTDKIAEKAEGYAGEIYNAYGSHASTKKNREFKENENNIKLARQNYKKRHDGEEPIGRALDDELEKMFTMNSHGIEKGQFNDVLSQAEEYVAKDGMSEDEALNTAMTSALYAQRYSGKDFADEKTMGQAYDELYGRYGKAIKSGKISKEQADKNIRNILSGGAKMKGVKNPALPKPQTNNATVDIPINREIPDLATNLGINESSLTDERVERLTQLRARLVDAGYTPDQIARIAQLSQNSRVNEEGVIGIFEDKVELAIEYLDNDNARHGAEQIVRGPNGIVAPKEQVDTEMRDRFILKSTFNVSNEDTITGMRAVEVEQLGVKEKTQKQAARDFARDHKLELEKPEVSDAAREKLIGQLRAGDKTASREKIAKDADNIIATARIYLEQ